MDQNPHKLVFSPIQVEAVAAREGLFLVMEGGFNDIILECDSLQIVEALPWNSSDMSNEGHIIEDSKDALLRITETSVSHTRRQGKGVAHLLARSALRMDSSSCSWFEEPLDLMLDLLSSDCK